MRRYYHPETEEDRFTFLNGWSGPRVGGYMERFSPRFSDARGQVHSAQFTPEGNIDPMLLEMEEARRDAQKLAEIQSAVQAGLAEYTPLQRLNRSRLQNQLASLDSDRRIPAGMREAIAKELQTKIKSIDFNPQRRAPGDRPKDTATAVQSGVFWDGGSWGKGTPWVIDPESGQPQVPRGYTPPEKTDSSKEMAAKHEEAIKRWKAKEDARQQYITFWSSKAPTKRDPETGEELPAVPSDQWMSMVLRGADKYFGPAEPFPAYGAGAGAAPPPGATAGPAGSFSGAGGMAPDGPQVVVDNLLGPSNLPHPKAGLGYTQESQGRTKRDMLTELLHGAAAAEDPTLRGSYVKMADLLAKGRANWTKDDESMYRTAKAVIARSMPKSPPAGSQLPAAVPAPAGVAAADAGEVEAFLRSKIDLRPGEKPHMGNPLLGPEIVPISEDEAMGNTLQPGEKAHMGIPALGPEIVPLTDDELLQDLDSRVRQWEALGGSAPSVGKPVLAAPKTAQESKPKPDQVEYAKALLARFRSQYGNKIPRDKVEQFRAAISILEQYEQSQ